MQLGESLPAFAHSLGRLAWAEYVARTCYSDASQPGLVEEACTRSSGNFGMTPPALITSKTDFIPLAQSDENRAPTPVTTCTHLSIQAANAIYIAPPSLDTLDCCRLQRPQLPTSVQSVCFPVQINVKINIGSAHRRNHVHPRQSWPTLPSSF
mgnify:CR=1 FL=1